MRGLEPHELLAVWERGAPLSPAQRALLMLSAGREDQAAREAGGLSVGRRDSRLLSLRVATFGSRMTGLADCPVCATALEWSVDARDVGLSEDASPSSQPYTLRLGDWEVRFGLPTAQDLADLPSGDGLEANRRRLLGACVIEALKGGKPVDAQELPYEFQSALSARMAELDPQAEIHMALHCPACGHDWMGVFDVATYLWAEMSVLAERLLREVHEMASAYGWSEADILAMRPGRREAYLEMIRQ